jgi:glycosyltransferase involved in cell wall biosynthesis
MNDESTKIKPLVSAIVSTYNSAKFIRGKLDDLLEQSINDMLEIIVINSGSKQNEDDIVKEYLEKYSNIKYIKTEQRETIYKAWNRGIKIATGDFITNANTDDRLKKNALEILSNTLINNPDVALVYADQYMTNEPNQHFEDVKKKNIIKMPDFDYLIQLERCIVFSQPMWRSSLHFKDNIWFDETLEVCGDHEFELNISRTNKMKHIPFVLGSFYKSPSNQNKSFQNISMIDLERKTITLHYMQEYIKQINDVETILLINKFKFMISLPMIVSRILLKIKRLFIKKKHVFSQEFIYMIMIMIYDKTGHKDKSEKLSIKYLKHRFSWRIKDIYYHNTNTSTEITNYKND